VLPPLLASFNQLLGAEEENATELLQAQSLSLPSVQ
jgi:hypothetical protein